MSDRLEQLKKIIFQDKSPEKIRVMFDRHNQRCIELGLNKLYSPGQGCAYRGGFPL
jgi:hypothetical protein